MTIAQKTPEPGSHASLDPIEALRHVNIWEAGDSFIGTVRIKIFRSYSAEFIEPFLKYYFGTLRLRCEVLFGGFDSFHQDVLEDRELQSYDLIVLSLTADALITGRHEGVSVEDAIAKVLGIVEHAGANASAPIILNTLTRPLLDEGGAVFSLQPQSLTSRVDDYNARLRGEIAKRAPRCVLVDWERLVMLIGADAAFDARMAYMAAAPFRHGFLNLYAHEIFRLGRALRGLAKKCLVLDCDNTLWGGVVGEVGREGIELDPSEYPGKAYYDFHKAVVRLAQHGVMVALCSKNNPQDVMDVLDRHPHCLIKRNHLVAHRINWDDKEHNLQQLVDDLGIGMDAVVFVDDNPVECARIRGFLPAVTVRQVPDRLYELPTLLDREGLFDKLATTPEDLSRATMYQSEEKRRDSQRSYATTEEFLASLEIAARIRRATDSEIARVAQLTQKTNQFNLTTRRYGEGELAGMAADPHWAIYSLSARDRFGDLGLTGVLIARRDDEEASIDTLLMSCRVLGRRLEDQFVVHCLGALNEAWMPSSWQAVFAPTAKNGQVENFWPRFGFKEIGSSDDQTLYRAEPGSLLLRPVPFIALDAG